MTAPSHRLINNQTEASHAQSQLNVHIGETCETHILRLPSAIAVDSMAGISGGPLTFLRNHSDSAMASDFCAPCRLSFPSMPDLILG
jgi:hypothetical protein